MIKVAGRKDFEDIFYKTNILHEKLDHTPFLVFEETEEGTIVHIVREAKKVLEFPDSTQLMIQWEGKWRSDFFQFTVFDLRRAYEKIVLPPEKPNQPEIKKIDRDEKIKLLGEAVQIVLSWERNEE